MTHVNVPITLVVIGTFVVVLALFVLLRSAMLSRGVLDCFLWRPRARGGAGAWRGGRLRFASDGLHWHRTDSLLPSAEVVLRRSEILDVVRHPVGSEGTGETGPVPDAELEFQRRGDEPLWLMVPFTTSSAVVAWYEAAPTGIVRGDAD
jgi:hypothetical protein